MNSDSLQLNLAAMPPNLLRSPGPRDQKGSRLVPPDQGRAHVVGPSISPIHELEAAGEEVADFRVVAGILEVKVPKVEQEKPQRIEVKGAPKTVEAKRATK